jgi:hypothetical protein
LRAPFVEAVVLPGGRAIAYATRRTQVGQHPIWRLYLARTIILLGFFFCGDDNQKTKIPDQRIFPVRRISRQDLEYVPLGLRSLAISIGMT